VTTEASDGLGGESLRLAELEVAVRELSVRPSWYGIGTEKDNALCIVREGQDWKVFFSERGDRYDAVTFRSEEEACNHFLHELKNDMRLDDWPS
jgi:hypothetical protein